jgi:hypothetical protein
MLGHGKPSYRTRESPRKDSVFRNRQAALSREIAQRAKDNVIKYGNACPFSVQHPVPEFGNHNSRIGPELSLVFFGRAQIFSERFRTSRRSIWYKW